MANRNLINSTLEESRVRERARLAAKAAQIKETYLQDESFYNDEFDDELFEDDENQLPVDPSSLQSKKGTGITVNIDSSVPTYYVKGKQMTPEGAYATAHQEALVAACFAFYTDNTVGMEGGSIEVFTAIAMQLLSVNGTAIPKLDTGGVLASVKHIKRAGIDPYKAMRDTAEAVKRNAARSAIADANSVGAASHIVFQDTGSVIVPSHQQLNNITTKALGNLAVVHIPTLSKTVDSVVQTMGNFNVHTKGIASQLMEMQPHEAPEIKESNVFRPYTRTPGTMTDGALPRGGDGYYVQALRYLGMVENEVPEILFVPEATTISNSKYDPADELSAIISLPKDSDMSMGSPALMATVVPWEKVKSHIHAVEMACKNDVAFKGKNARATAHAECKQYYDHYRNNGHGETPQGQRYVALYGADPVSADELMRAHDLGELNERVALIRAGDFNNAKKAGLNTGSFVWIDLPSMMGLYFSDAYTAMYVRNGAKTDEGGLKHMKGYLVMKQVPSNAMPTYMTWLCRYMFSYLVSVRLFDSELREKLKAHYLEVYSIGKRFPSQLFSEMEWVYGGAMPALNAVVVRYAAYSMTKVAKYSTIMSDDMDLGTQYGDMQRSQRKPITRTGGVDDAPLNDKITIVRREDEEDSVDLDQVGASSMYGEERT